jgi:hypothetical protein
MRTARSTTSGENFDFLMMAPSSQMKEPPQIPGRFIDFILAVFVNLNAQLIKQSAAHVWTQVGTAFNPPAKVFPFGASLIEQCLLPSGPLIYQIFEPAWRVMKRVALTRDHVGFWLLHRQQRQSTEIAVSVEGREERHALFPLQESFLVVNNHRGLRGALAYKVVVAAETFVRRGKIHYGARRG